MRTKLIAWAIPLLLLLLAPGCSISQEEELRMGRQMHGQFEAQFGGVVPDPRLQQYVNDVGMRMASRAGRPALDWQFRVLESDQVNAFAVPGGYVYITRGLYDRLENEAQLAGVLGHEAAHVAHRHSVRQLERARGAQIGSTVIGVVGAVFGVGGVGEAAGLVSSLALMNYSRGQEKESDLSALRYLTSEGYNPTAMVETMKVLQAASGKGGGRGPEFLATHPNPGNRIEYLTEAIEQKYPDAAARGAFAQDSFRRQMLTTGVAGAGAVPAMPGAAGTSGSPALTPGAGTPARRP